MHSFQFLLFVAIFMIGVGNNNNSNGSGVLAVTPTKIPTRKPTTPTTKVPSKKPVIGTKTPTVKPGTTKVPSKKPVVTTKTPTIKPGTTKAPSKKPVIGTKTPTIKPGTTKAPSKKPVSGGVTSTPTSSGLSGDACCESAQHSKKKKVCSKYLMYEKTTYPGPDKLIKFLTSVKHGSRDCVRFIEAQNPPWGYGPSQVNQNRK
jgi:hypothetical protein